MYNDFLLIRKMKQGDDNAFDLFVHKYYQEILSYCYHHCFDQTYAEDLTQETFIRFFTKLSDYHYKGKTLNYLYTIAGNLCKDYLKRTKETLLEENAFEEENQTEQILNRVLIEQILEQLPDDSREVLTLYYFQELKLTEISDTLQIGLPLVKYRLQKARKQLREYDEYLYKIRHLVENAFLLLKRWRQNLLISPSIAGSPCRPKAGTGR